MPFVAGEARLVAHLTAAKGLANSTSAPSPKQSGWLIALWSWTFGSALSLLLQASVTCKMCFGPMLSILNSSARKQFGFLAWHCASAAALKRRGVSKLPSRPNGLGQTVSCLRASALNATNNHRTRSMEVARRWGACHAVAEAQRTADAVAGRLQSGSLRTRQRSPFSCPYGSGNSATPISKVEA
jgi:hypothetical protein